MGLVVKLGKQNLCIIHELMLLVFDLQVVTAAVPQATVVHHAIVKPPNYLALSLINLLCCCWPLGIVGLVYSLRVRSLL